MVRQPKRLGEQELHAYALKALGARALSLGEMRVKLERRALRKSDVEAVITRLKSAGLLNDERFAAAYASWRVDARVGRQRVERDLRARRVAPEAAKRAVDRAFADTDEIAMLREQIAKLTRRTGPPKDRRATAALYRRLLSGGFSPSQIFPELRRIRKEDAEALEESIEDSMEE